MCERIYTKLLRLVACEDPGDEEDPGGRERR